MSGASGMSVREMLRAIIGIDGLPTSVLGKVKSVNQEEKTCIVTPIDQGSDYVDVLLMADASDIGIYIVPVIDSLVMITPQNEQTYFVSMFGPVASILLRGDANGGVVKASDLVTKINTLENNMNLIVAWGATVTPPLSGIAPIIPTTALEISSTTVKHG